MNNNAKKIIVSLVVVLIFAGYIYQQRHGNSSSKIVAAPTQKTSPSSSDSSSSGLSQKQLSSSSSSSTYRDGSYTGSSEDAFYGFIRVKAVISNGAISDIVFLTYPNDQHNSEEINQQAMPILKQEAIKNQSFKVDIVSGATDTSYAFIESLKTALNQAKA